MSGTGIYIGANKDAVVAARAAILDILKTPVEERTKRHALSTLHSICGVNGTTISGCHIAMGEKA